MDTRYAVFSYDTDTTKRLMAAVSLENRFWSPSEAFYFYRSSGENSTHANTWFPCQGVSNERKATKNYTDDDTLVEIGFTIASLGMYAYLKNCVDRREDHLSTPTAIAKIALAVLLPPVAMIVGIFSLFYPAKKCDSTGENIEKTGYKKEFIS